MENELKNFRVCFLDGTDLRFMAFMECKNWKNASLVYFSVNNSKTCKDIQNYNDDFDFIEPKVYNKYKSIN